MKRNQILTAVLLVLLGLYHIKALPSTQTPARGGSMNKVMGELKEVIVSFFQKKHI